MARPLCSLLWFFALIALQFQVFQFSFFRFFFFVSRLLLFFYRLCGALPQNVSVGFVVLVVVVIAALAVAVAVVSATESVGVDFYLYLRSLVQHYTSKVGSGLVGLPDLNVICRTD